MGTPINLPAEMQSNHEQNTSSMKRLQLSKTCIVVCSVLGSEGTETMQNIKHARDSRDGSFKTL